MRIEEKPVAAYWERTLRLFIGRPVRVVLADGRARHGVLTGSEGSFKLWTAEGVVGLPLGELATVEQA